MPELELGYDGDLARSERAVLPPLLLLVLAPILSCGERIVNDLRNWDTVRDDGDMICFRCDWNTRRGPALRQTQHPSIKYYRSEQCSGGYVSLMGDGDHVVVGSSLYA
jgi:hypothetical protein